MHLPAFILLDKREPPKYRQNHERNRIAQCGRRTILDLTIMPYAIRILQVVILSALLTGCSSVCAELFAPRPHSHVKDLGHIDLSLIGAKYETTVRWPDPCPSLALTLSDTNGGMRASGTHPDWPLIIQIDFIDENTGKTVVSSHITKDQMEFAVWHLPATCLSIPLAGWYDVLQKGHSYKLVMTVLQEQKDLGSANISLEWVTGGDSM
jgi:hypothetical protein